MPQVEYAAVSAMPREEPFNPSVIPIIPAGTNTVDSSQIACMHDKFLRIYTNRINVDHTLKRIMLEAYYNMYTYQLEDYLLQYANRSELEAENCNKMEAPINFQDPIETLFKNIEYGVCYANTGIQPYMEAHYINIAFLLILNTGAIPDYCRDWKRRTPVNKAWDDFTRESA
jgi:hypothetical protein